MAGVLLTVATLISLATAANAQSPKISILVDLDPNSAAQTVIVESIAADQQDAWVGRSIFLLSGNLRWRIL